MFHFVLLVSGSDRYDYMRTQVLAGRAHIRWGKHGTRNVTNDQGQDRCGDFDRGDPHLRCILRICSANGCITPT